MTTATDTRPRVWAFWHAPGGRGHNDEGVWHVVRWSSQGELSPRGITRCAHCSGALPVGNCAGGAFTCEYQLALRGTLASHALQGGSAPSPGVDSGPPVAGRCQLSYCRVRFSTTQWDWDVTT